MDTGITLLEKEEYSQIWDRVYTELHFQPSVYENVPFQVPAPWAVHGLLFEPTGEQGERFEETVRQALVDCLGEDPWLYALDWQHSGFRYDPRVPVAEHDNWVENGRIPGWCCNAYFPDFYPDGDYYFFLQRDLKWGYLGHPWRRELWLFGAPLVEALSPKLEALGFPLKKS